MPALERLSGLRVVAKPDALDRAKWQGNDVVVARFASDEALGIGASGVVVDDPDAIVEPDAGFVGVRTSAFASLEAHMEWPLPEDSEVLAQGKIAGVPAKLLGSGRLLLITQSAYAEELTGRLECIE